MDHHNLWLPISADEMIREAREVAQDVDAQYVLTYKPVPPLEASGRDEYRSIEVISRRAGLAVKSRRSYVLRSDPSN